MAALLRFVRRHELDIACILVGAWILLGLALAILSSADGPPMPPTGGPGYGVEF